MPHPLEHKFVLKVQTDKATTPVAVVEGAVENLIADLATLEDRIKVRRL